MDRCRETKTGFAPSVPSICLGVTDPISRTNNEKRIRMMTPVNAVQRPSGGYCHAVILWHRGRISKRIASVGFPAAKIDERRYGHRNCSQRCNHSPSPHKPAALRRCRLGSDFQLFPASPISRNRCAGFFWRQLSIMVAPVLEFSSHSAAFVITEAKSL